MDFLRMIRSSLSHNQYSQIFSNPSGVTPEAVRWAYRLFLGREPENHSVVADKVRRNKSIEELRKEMLSSPEFINLYGSPQGEIRHSFDPPLKIDVEVSSQVMDELFIHIQKVWRYLGETEPHWSVLSAEPFLKENIRENLDTFYLSGKEDVDRILATLERNHIDYSHFQTCIDYGCGIGRVTRWLAKRFGEVYGYDISPSHIEIGREYIKNYGLENVLMHHLQGLEQLTELPTADLIYSVIVLQHNPPPLIRYILIRFLRALRPNGVALVQVPTYRLGYKFKVSEYIKSMKSQVEMEMHCLPQYHIFQIVSNENAIVLEVQEDRWTGSAHGEISNTFLIQKL